MDKGLESDGGAGSARAAAVTGFGVVSGFGGGRELFWRHLVAGDTAIRPIKRFPTDRHRTALASEVPAGSADEGGRRATLADRFALAAAAEAIAAAGLAAGFGDRRVGVFFGSSTGGTWESERFFAALTRSTGRRAPIGGLVSQQPNGPADAVARRYRVTGPVLTLSSACASATLALGAALEALRSGEVDVALAGGADALCELTFAGFNALRAVDPQPCRPFRREREGMSIGEGAAVIVLERQADAAARGVGFRTLLLGAGASCDAHHMTAPEPSGAGVARAIRGALADSGVAPEAVDFVNAHGTGTPLNDAAEWQALKAVFGDRAAALPVTSTKAAVGHFLGAAGAVEAVATLLCLEHRLVHPTPGAGTRDPEAPADLVVGGPRALPAARCALSANFAFGGSNAAAVFARSEGR